MQCIGSNLTLDSPYGLLLHRAIVWQNVKMTVDVNSIARTQPMHLEKLFG